MGPSAASETQGWLAALRAFDGLLEAPAGERTARLAALDAADPSLGAAVARLLAAHEAAERGEGSAWLERGPSLATAAAGADDPGGAPDARFGPWRLLREIGCGGMSRVWLARREDIPWAREVALKVPLHAPLRLRGAGGVARSDDDPFERELHRRFVLERDLLSRLEHPHIARLYDAGFVDGVPWLALEYVRGEDLLRWCDRQALGLRERVQLFRQAVQAVAYAHAALILHRDLKPANLMVSEGGTLRLLDFGIGRLLDTGDLAAGGDVGTPAATLAPTGMGRPMTPAYASPEQWRHETLTTASDVYSLGVVLHELVAGEHPFAAAGSDLSRLGPAIARGAARPASQVARASPHTRVRAVADRVRGDLDAVIARALHPQAGSRYASAAEFDADLERWVDGRPVRARRPSFARSLGKTVRRHPWTSAGLAGGVAAVAASVVVALVQAREARNEQARASATLGFVLGLFDQGDPGLNAGREPRVRELLAAGEREIAAMAPGRAALQVELQGAMARLWLTLGERTQAAALRAQRSDAMRTAGPGFEAALARALADEAEVALSDFRLVDARRQLAEAQAALDALGPGGMLRIGRWIGRGDPAPRARSEVALRQAYLLLLDNAPADRTLAAFTRARDLAEAAADGRSLRLARVELRQALLEVGRTEEAIEGLLEEEDALRKADPALSPYERIYLRSRLLDMLGRAGALALAAPAIDRLAADGEAQYGPSHPEALSARVLWLVACLRVGRVDEARRWLHDIGGLTERVARLQPVAAIEWWMSVSRLAVAAGDLTGAQQALAPLAAAVQAVGADDADLRQLGDLAELEVALALGQSERVLRRLDEPLWRQDVSPRMTVLRLHLRGLALAQTGQLHPALAEWERALSAVGAPAAFGPDSAMEARLRLNRAVAWRSMALAAAGAVSGPSGNEAAFQTAAREAGLEASRAEAMFRARFGDASTDTRLAAWLSRFRPGDGPADASTAPVLALPDEFRSSGLPGGYRP